jgi:aldehyde:ferredoxin oxidoreductase
MFSGGYTGKLLRVDLSKKTFRQEDVPDEYYRSLLGGRGVAAKYYYDEIGPDVKPLSAENKLIFMNGPLTGAPVYSSTKFQLATRSPLTGQYLCSNSSGFAGPQLKFAGYDGLIIEGRSEKPVYIVIRDKQVEFHDAAGIWGNTTFEVDKYIKEKHEDRQFGVMSIGPAGENVVSYACIQVDGRSFGRGGGGAVMGWKNLKCIAVRGTGKLPLANETALKEFITANLKACRDGKAGHTKFGTAQYTEVINNLGCYSVKNFQTGELENAQGIYAGELVSKYKIKNGACYRCPVACGQVCEVREGPFKGAVSDPEYETIGAFGGQTCVTDMAAIIAANEICDELGMDTMQAGTAIGFAMELYERGLITREDTGGLDLRFGNGEAMVAMLPKIARKEGLGAVLAKSFYELADEHPDWAKYMLHVKGMAYAAYEPRGFYGMGLAYGTSSRGACHNVGGWTIRDELTSGKYDRFALAGKGKMVKDIQDTRAYIDSLGICTVVRGSMGFSDAPHGKILEYVTGYDFTPDLMPLGERVYTLERLILRREGVSRKDDYLPDRTMTEKLPSGMAKDKVLTREMYDVMLDEYYALRGWDHEGNPTKDAIQSQGLKKFVA